MLLKFSVTNYKSIRDTLELSFVSTARKDKPPLRFGTRHVKHGVLPVVGLWGANASGKTNVLQALIHVKNLIENSYIGLSPGQDVPWPMWEPRVDGAVARAEIDILMADDTRVHYGFELVDGGVSQEWLFTYHSARRTIVFHRDHTEDEPWYFGPSLNGAKKSIALATRPNSLFLSAAAQHNNETLLPIFTAIVAGIIPARAIRLSGYPVFRSDEGLLSDEFRPTLVELLCGADLGVEGVRTEEFETDEPDSKQMEKIFQPTFLQQLLETAKKRQRVVVALNHRRDGTKTWEAPPEAESRGTAVFLARIGDLYKALSSGGLLVIDEIDTSLHPDLCASLVDLFTNSNSNPHRAQLLFTTHDRGLLERLRTDEVVMIDKGFSGVTELRSASEYERTRSSLRTAHERGQLRGVPVLGDLAGVLSTGLMK